MECVLADRLKELRRELGISQRDLARSLKLSPSTIAMYETGQREPDSKTLDHLASFFDVSLDYLVGRSDVRQSLHNKQPVNIDRILAEHNVLFDGKPLTDADKLVILDSLRMVRRAMNVSDTTKSDTTKKE